MNTKLRRVGVFGMCALVGVLLTHVEWSAAEAGD